MFGIATDVDPNWWVAKYQSRQIFTMLSYLILDISMRRCFVVSRVSHTEVVQDAAGLKLLEFFSEMKSWYQIVGTYWIVEMTQTHPATGTPFARARSVRLPKHSL